MIPSQQNSEDYIMTRHGYYIDNRDALIYSINDVRPGWNIVINERPNFDEVLIVSFSGAVEDSAVLWESREELISAISGNK